MAAKVPKYYCSYNYVIGYQINCIPHRHSIIKPYYIQYTPGVYERMTKYDAYVAWSAGGWHFQQNIFYLQKCRFCVKWLHQGTEGYSENQ